MQILQCPKCKQKMVKIYTIGNEDKTKVDFSLKEATETTICRNCGAKIAYSVSKNARGEEK